MEVINIKISDIHMDDDFNCRGVIAPMDVVDLAKDIEASGLIQPIVVTPYDAEMVEKTGFKYRLLAGFRRTTAHKVLLRTPENKSKFSTISASIKEHITESEARFLNLKENVNREDLTILQEAQALSKLKELGVTEVDCANHLNKSRGWVQIRYMLLGLPEQIQNEVAAGFITQSQIRDLYSVFRTAGLEACINETKGIKDAKINGRKHKIKVKKKDNNSKKRRDRGEILVMLEHIYDGIGPCLGTRTLSWAAGEISENDLYTSIKEEADVIGKLYSIPTS